MERKKALKEKGYLTVESLLRKLEELKENGLGDELIAGYDLNYFQICEYDGKLKTVIIE